MYKRNQGLMLASAAFGALGLFASPGPAFGVTEKSDPGRGPRPKKNGKVRRHGSKLKPNRKTVSRRVKRRHRRARKAA